MQNCVNILRTVIAFLIVAGLAFYVLIYHSNNTKYLYQNPILSTAGGQGSPEKPFLIASEAQFISLRDSVNASSLYEGCYFLQTADLNFEAYGNWEPIG